MDNKLSYEELINGINNGDIDEVHFSVTSYAHYRSCYLKRAYYFSPILNKTVFSHVELILTEDQSEKSIYYGPFGDKYPVFVIKGKGKFNLKQIYKDVEILSVKYKDK